MHPPSAFGSFRVLHQIGSGVLGPVFRAYDAQRERLAAIKAFKVDLLPEHLPQFADALGSLVARPVDDSGVVAAIDSGVEGTTPFLALEFVSGETLDAILRESRQLTPLTPEQALDVCSAIGRAIDAAWNGGVGHGALHPRDVFVTETGGIAVTGFGVAQALMAVGLRAPVRRPYSAPEREAGRDWDRRADVYSLAAITRELLGTTAALPAAVGSVFADALADDPAGRFETAGAFVEAVRSATAITEGFSSVTVSSQRPNEIEIDGDREMAWAPDPVADAELRAVEPMAPWIGVTMRERHAVIAPRFPWMALIAASLACLAAGGLIGFRIGFSRGSDARIVSELAAATTPPPAPAKDTSPEPVEAPVTQPVADATSGAAPEAASSAARRNTAVSKATAGSIEVDSRPRGARVSVDGRPVGQTPLKVTAMSPGDHRVLIELKGHRRVTSTVKVVAGEQARLAVSLEQTGGEPDARRRRN